MFQKGAKKEVFKVLLKDTGQSVSEAHSTPCRISPQIITSFDKQVLKAVLPKLSAGDTVKKVSLSIEVERPK